MSLFFLYILKLSLSLSVVFLFYQLALRKLTFYNWNRWYLTGYTILCFFIPLINISPVLDKNDWSNSDVINWVPVIEAQPASASTASTIAVSSFFSIENIILLSLATGILVMLGRLIIQVLSFRKMMKKATLVNSEGLHIYHVDENIIPFSFGNSIFINQYLHSEKELQDIIGHEFVHVKQRHSFDIIWGEVLCMLNWYNPFAWLLKKAIRQNLEFIADNKVLEQGVAKKQYQYLLLKVIGNNQFSIANQFNFSSLKKRIAMINKIRSAKVHLLKFVFLLPVVIVMLLAFRNKYEKTHQQVPAIPVTMSQDTVPVSKKNAVKMPGEISSLSMMLSREDEASSDPVKQKLKGVVVVKRKDGEKEMYDLDKQESLDAFEKKYGVKLEDLIPPPPPLPPAPQTGVTGERPLTPPPPPPPATGSINVIAPPAPVTSADVEGIRLNGIASEFEITDKSAFIKLKDGKTEKYDLTDPKEKAAFEKKYGRIIRTNVNTSVNLNAIAAVSTANGINVIAPVTASVNTNVTAIAGPVPAINGRGTGTTVIAPMGYSTTNGVTIVDDYGYTITGKEDILVTITKNTTRQELDNFIKQMKEKGIELNYDEIEYNDNGKLVSISGSMKSKDGHSNFVAADFNKLILAMIKKGDKTYFKVSVQDKNQVI